MLMSLLKALGPVARGASVARGARSKRAGLASLVLASLAEDPARQEPLSKEATFPDDAPPPPDEPPSAETDGPAMPEDALDAQALCALLQPARKG